MQKFWTFLVNFSKSYSHHRRVILVSTRMWVFSPVVRKVILISTRMLIFSLGCEKSKSHVHQSCQILEQKHTILGSFHFHACNLKMHLKIYSGEKLNKCSQCDYESSRVDHLRTHLKKHSAEKSNQCEFASSHANSLKGQWKHRKNCECSPVLLLIVR